MLSVKDIYLTLSTTSILDNISIAFEKGKVTGLIGPNGAGKSTLLRVLANLQTVDAGTVTFTGQTIQTIHPLDYAKKVTYLPQTAVCHWPLTVEQLVTLGRYPHQTNDNLSEEDTAAVTQAVEETDISHLLGRTVNTLSGGERARVMLARALATDADVLLADEPIVALDPRHQIDVMALLQTLANKGKTVIVVLHELHLAMRYCDNLVLLNNGQTIAEGSPIEVITQKNLKNVYEVDAIFGSHQHTPWVLPWLNKKGADT